MPVVPISRTFEVPGADLVPTPPDPAFRIVREALMHTMIASIRGEGILHEYVMAHNVSTLMHEAALAGRLIDAGHLPDRAIRDCGKRGAMLAYERAFDHPFNKPWLLTHTWTGDDETTFDNMLAMIEGEDDPAKRARLQAVLDQHRSSPSRCYYLYIPQSTAECFAVDAIEFSMLYSNRMRAHVFMPLVLVHCLHKDPNMFRAQAFDIDGPATGENKGIAATALNPMMAALMLLNTKGVPTETQPASKRRAGYVRIDSGEYMTAVLGRKASRRTAAGGGATDARRASPVPHIRRGHSRTYADGRSVWIRDMLINCKSEGELAWAERHRTHYRVGDHRLTDDHGSG